VSWICFDFLCFKTFGVWIDFMLYSYKFGHETLKDGLIA
jgi:hypothetical protein